MKASFSEKITASLITQGVISTESKSLYTYGLQQGMQILFNLLTTIVTGLAFGMLWQSLVFTLAYIPLRAYAGGYHANTQLKCYFSSTVTLIGVLLLVKLVPWNFFICLIAAIAAGIVIFLLAPVEDANKPLDQTEIKVYKKRSRYILCLLFILIFLFWSLSRLQAAICITMALDFLAVMLLLGKIKRQSLKNREEE